MRLLGYPSSKISILTTYNGQKELINDVLKQRCSSSLFGRPGSVSTVDTYQGQQNDYILLSLVRTESIGHLKDIRRLVVALSRARLGLYVFCRHRLFENCYELTPSFNILLSKPSKLQLVVGEGYVIDEETNEISSEARGVNASIDKKNIVYVEDVSNMGILVYQMVQQSGSCTASIEMSA
jgi:intron-binding protein aquarius